MNHSRMKKAGYTACFAAVMYGLPIIGGDLASGLHSLGISRKRLMNFGRM